MNQPVFIQRAAEPGRVRFTTVDYQQMRDAGAFADFRVELVQGDLAKMMPSYLAHGEINLSLAARLKAAYGDAARVGVDVLLATGTDSVRAPDIAVARPDAPSGHPLPPDAVTLLVEIADTTLARDLGAKLDDYAAAGVRHYWVVDLSARVVHVMSDPVDGAYRERRVVRFDEPLPIPDRADTITLG